MSGVTATEGASAALGSSGFGDVEIGRGGTETGRIELGGVDCRCAVEGVAFAIGLTDGIGGGDAERTASGRVIDPKGTAARSRCDDGVATAFATVDVALIAGSDDEGRTDAGERNEGRLELGGVDCRFAAEGVAFAVGLTDGIGGGDAERAACGRVIDPKGTAARSRCDDGLATALATAGVALIEGSDDEGRTDAGEGNGGRTDAGAGSSSQPRSMSSTDTDFEPTGAIGFVESRTK